MEALAFHCPSLPLGSGNFTYLRLEILSSLIFILIPRHKGLALCYPEGELVLWPGPFQKTGVVSALNFQSYF
jgi:hypothetical protein